MNDNSRQIAYIMENQDGPRTASFHWSILPHERLQGEKGLASRSTS